MQPGLFPLNPEAALGGTNLSALADSWVSGADESDEKAIPIQIIAATTPSGM
jgi:hypothetical protein